MHNMGSTYFLSCEFNELLESSATFDEGCGILGKVVCKDPKRLVPCANRRVTQSPKAGRTWGAEGDVRASNHT